MTSVTIIGGGILGLACAWTILRRGRHVRVIEARQIGAGSSGGHVGALSPHVPDNWNDKKAFQLQSLLAAPAFWAEVEDASGLPSGYGRMGRLQPIADQATVGRLADRIAAAQLRWPRPLGMHLTREPQTALIPGSPTGLWLFDGLSARVNPRAALAALTAAIRTKGGEVTEGAFLEPDQTPATALWATGVEGLAMLSDDLGQPIGVGVKGQSALLSFSASEAPQVFADGLHIVPHADGTVAVGSTSENSFDHADADAQIDALIDRARLICPVLADAPVIDRWAGIRPRARSRAPILGRWPGRDGHFIANGGFKIGFGMAPEIAACMADLIIADHDRIPAPFRL